MKKSAQRIITIASLIVIVLLFSFFLRDVLVPLVRFQMANDVDGARALLTSKGVFGFLTVLLVEAPPSSSFWSGCSASPATPMRRRKR